MRLMRASSEWIWTCSSLPSLCSLLLLLLILIYTLQQPSVWKSHKASFRVHLRWSLDSVALFVDSPLGWPMHALHFAWRAVVLYSLHDQYHANIFTRELFITNSIVSVKHLESALKFSLRYASEHECFYLCVFLLLLFCFAFALIPEYLDVLRLLYFHHL